MRYHLSEASLRKLAECHPDLQEVAKEAIKDSEIDFGISHGYRDPDYQFELFKKGRTFLDGRWVKTGAVVTYLDGYEKRSKHNFTPSPAFDIFLWPREIMYDSHHLAAVGHHIIATASRLRRMGKIASELRWGNNWNGNGLMVAKDDQEKFVDAPHFELI